MKEGKGRKRENFIYSVQGICNLTRTKHLIVDLRKRLDNRVENIVIVLISMSVVRAVSCSCSCSCSGRRPVCVGSEITLFIVADNSLLLLLWLLML
jgi:hypothetical protein